MNTRVALWLAVMLALIASVVIALLRFYPLAWNLAAVGALALFAGARLRSWWALALPLGLMLLTDYWLSVAKPDNPFLHQDTVFVYGSYALIFALGRLLARTENLGKVLALSVGGSVLFFLITNFGSWLNAAVLHTVPVWPGYDDYEANLGGLLLCYERAIPFYRGTLAGELVFSMALFGAHSLATRRLAATETPQEAAS